LLLLVAAMQINDCGPTDQEKETIVRMQAQGVLPPSPWDPATFRAPPSPLGAPATPPAASENAAGSGGSSKGNKRWWEDPPDAAWRQEKWFEHHAERTRTIKVKGNKNEGWIELAPYAVRELLHWYDRAAVFVVYKEDSAATEKRHFYDYRYEGGRWLSQRNPNFPESNPKACQVLYVGAVPEDGNW